MQGRRRAPNTKPWNLKPGEYMLRRGIVWCQLPTDVGPCRLEGWTYEVHENGTISVNPSIHDVGTEDGYHGWLRRGVWEP